MDIDPVIRGSVHVNVNGDAQVNIRVELGIAESAKHCGFGTGQLVRRYRQSCSHNAANAGGKAVNRVRLIDAGTVGSEGYGQTLGLVGNLRNSLFYHIGVELLGGTALHDGFNFLEVILPAAVHRVVEMLMSICEVRKAVRSAR